MKPDKAPGYWPTRILLGVAIVATAITVTFALSSVFWAPPMSGGPHMLGGAGPSVFGLPSHVVIPVLPAAIAIIGLAWTIRIFRGPRDEPPPWRYRDR